MGTIKDATRRQETMEVHAALQYSGIFQCQVDDWHDCGELKPKPLDKQKEQGKHQAEWCALSKNHKMYDMCNEKWKIKFLGSCSSTEWMGMEFSPKLRTLGTAHMAGHDLTWSAAASARL